MEASIIIPNFNGSKFLKDCLDSLLAQDHKDFEIIVIDDGSTDNSCNILKENYPQIKLVAFSDNGGFSRAVNAGIRQARGKYVILLNNDTIVKNNWISALVKCIDQDESIFSCSSKMIMNSDKEKIDDAGDFYTLFGWTIKRGLGKSIKRYNKSSEIFSACAGAAIYRKKVFEDIGYFDEKFFAYLEDVDIGYRAKVFGYKNVYCSEAIVYHIGSATSGSKYNSFKTKLSSRNNVFVIYKNMPFLQILINLPLLIIGFAIKTIFFYLKGLGSEYVRGIANGFREIYTIKKIKYRNHSLGNYIKIQIEIWVNTLRYILDLL